ESITYPAAFAAGLLSFFSPCILPLIPAYFTFVTGYSLEELTGEMRSGIRRKVIVATLAFGLGFSLIFILMGASASFMGGLAARYHQIIRVIGGLLIMVLGIHLTGLLRMRFLEVEKRVQLREKPTHIMGTVLVGMAFGAGWSPCIGPMLGSILILAGSEESVLEGVVLLTVFSAGLWIPFIIMSVFIDLMLGFLKRARRITKFVNIAAGTLLIGLGLALVFDRFGIFWSLIAPAAG
ncbi:MAG: cytochrome c biogenesis protein CcdA, partial [Desulfobacterales bacterium]